MESHFSSAFFTLNRQRLSQLFAGTAPVVLSANGLLQRGSDNTYTFSQEANFWYLSGINEPDLILVMDKSSEYLIVPNRSASRETFDGAIDHEALSKISGIKTIYDENEGWSKLRSKLKKVKHVATVGRPEPYIETYGFYTNPARATLVEKIKSYNSQIKFLDLNQHLSRLRMIKQLPEIEAITRAINITSSAIKEVTRPSKLSKYNYEYEIEADLTRGMRRRGADQHAFEPIIAGGRRACTLHNVSNNARLNSSDLILIDTGAEFEHYAADITRTYSLSGKATKRQQSVYNAALEVHDYAISLLKPGVLIKDYEQKVENFMGEKLRELGLIKIIDKENVRQYYPHATGHFLGLNVHDTGDYNLPLEPGVVLTVEPGIYIPEENIGVRIEDDILITTTNNKVLSGNLSHSLR
jgi:Xaa-Pro aminopeptidase